MAYVKHKHIAEFADHARAQSARMYQLAGDPNADPKLIRIALYGALALLRTLLAVYNVKK